MQSGCQDTLEEQYAIKLCFKLRKIPQKHIECFRLLFDHLAWIEHPFFEWHKRFKEGRESVRDDERCGRTKEVNTPELIGQRVRVRVRGYYVKVLREFRKRFLGKRPALFKSGQWHFHQDNAPVYNSILVIEYLTNMGNKTVSYPPSSPDIAPCDFCLFPKLSGCRYETIEEMKEAVTKVTDMQEDFNGAFQKLLEWYKKCIAARGDYFKGD